MRTEIITIGDELLIGQTVDTNSAWIGKKLNEKGFVLSRRVAVGDKEQDILEALADAAKRAEMVIITGGLGPTRDDITKNILCRFFDTRLVRNEEVLSRIEAFFRSFDRPMLEANIQQADLPEHCEVLPNYKGTASGMWFEKEGTCFVSLPGVPHEMEHLMETQVLPKMLSRFGSIPVLHKTIMTQGIGESFLAEQISDWEDTLAASKIKLAYLPSPGIVKLRLSSYGGDLQEQADRIEEAVAELYKLIPGYITAEDEETLEETVGKILKGKNATIAVAESCTGGFVAHLLTSIPGASAYFKGALVAYWNEVKMKKLGIDEKLLTAHGVVSEEVAAAMASAAREYFNAGYGIATTGMAGPTGGTEQVPVGTVCMAVASANGVITRRQKFGSDRQRVIERSTRAILNLLRKELAKDFGV